MFFTVNLSQDSSKISNYISESLLDAIKTTLEKGEKVLLYLNKRGSHSSLICEKCDKLYNCPNCDVSLSVHSNPEHLRCHICNNAFNIPKNCSECGSESLKAIGVGTQQIQQSISTSFPEANIYRFDSDAMKNISSKREALAQLDTADIIIGTKMLTTGFNFDKVGLICIVLVESELGYPSFDAQERAYTNLRQLIGRGNRKSQKTQIILQTFIPKNPLIQQLVHLNFKDFFHQTLTERKEFDYPPYKQMATLEYRHKDSKKSLGFTGKILEELQQIDTNNEYIFLRGSSTFRKNNTHHASIIIKGKNIRKLLRQIEKTIISNSALSVIFH